MALDLNRNYTLLQAPQSQAIGQSSNKGLTTSQYSLDDVGNYDDEDEGDTPPPLPPRTEDALILVDPPPSHDPPSLPPKPRRYSPGGIWD